MNLNDFGHLKFLSDSCLNKSLSGSINPFEEFVHWFTKYHNACILTLVTNNFYKQTDSFGLRPKEPYVYIEFLGVFTDLNKLAKRINSEINVAIKSKSGDIETEYKDYKPSVDFFNEMLIIKHPWENKEFRIIYTGIDETNDERHCEGWKYDLKIK